MIIFDLSCLADDSHRRHFIDPEYLDIAYWKLKTRIGGGYDAYRFGTGEHWQVDYAAYYAACDQDKVVDAVLSTFIHLTQGEPFNHDVQMWSGQCESTREKSLKWLVGLTGYTEDYGYWDRRLKMRPIGDERPTEQIFEEWLEATYEDTKWGARTPIEMAFSAAPEVVAMFRNRGIFTFDCRQG